MRVEESLNVRFDKIPPPKSSPLVDDDILESEIIENQEKDLEIKENEPLNKEIVNIKETKDRPIDSVIEDMTVKDGVRDVHASCDYKGNEHGPHVGPHVTWDYGYEIAALVHAYVYCSNACSKIVPSKED
ncbi:hypothetical protein Tco_0111103 [Tanacetum coccineum]